MEYFPLILKHRVTMMHFDLPDNMELILSIFRKLYANEYAILIGGAIIMIQC